MPHLHLASLEHHLAPFGGEVEIKVGAEQHRRTLRAIRRRNHAGRRYAGRQGDNFGGDTRDHDAGLTHSGDVRIRKRQGYSKDQSLQ